MEIQIGDFIRYKTNNELGLVGAIGGDNIRCWFNMGGTRAIVNSNQIESINIKEAMESEFSNEYAKYSLAERALRQWEGTDVSDLIDECDIRTDVVKILETIKDE